MVVTLCGISILFKATQPEKASLPIDSTEFGITTEGNFEHPSKQATPMSEHPSLMVRLESAVQFINVPVPILATFDPMVNRIVFCVVALSIVVVILTFMVIKWGKINKFYRACLMMIIAGGIGNVIDRIFYTPEFLGDANGVVDWIDFYGIWKFNFNIADSSVVVAAIMLIIYMIVHDAKEAIEKKKNEPKVEVDNTKVLSKTEQEKNKYLDQKQDE